MRGELTKREYYAKRIVKYGLKRPFYRLISHETFAGVSTKFIYGNECAKLYDVPGYYTIYRKFRVKLECLYVGKTDQSLYGRINRWAKGVNGSLRSITVDNAGAGYTDVGGSYVNICNCYFD